MVVIGNNIRSHPEETPTAFCGIYSHQTRWVHMLFWKGIFLGKIGRKEESSEATENTKGFDIYIVSAFSRCSVLSLSSIDR